MKISPLDSKQEEGPANADNEPGQSSNFVQPTIEELTQRSLTLEIRRDWFDNCPQISFEMEDTPDNRELLDTLNKALRTGLKRGLTLGRKQGEGLLYINEQVSLVAVSRVSTYVGGDFTRPDWTPSRCKQSHEGDYFTGSEGIVVPVLEPYS
jgi:hypothetical protein